MKVVDHEPSLWFLVSDGQDLILDVSCNHSAFGYTWTLKLLDPEREEYHSKGRDSLSQLAHQIQTSAPILKESQSPFKHRMISNAMQEEVEAAILTWNSGRRREDEP